MSNKKRLKVAGISAQWLRIIIAAIAIFVSLVFAVAKGISFVSEVENTEAELRAKITELNSKLSSTNEKVMVNIKLIDIFANSTRRIIVPNTEEAPEDSPSILLSRSIHIIRAKIGKGEDFEDITAYISERCDNISICTTEIIGSDFLDAAQVARPKLELAIQWECRPNPASKIDVPEQDIRKRIFLGTELATFEIGIVCS